MEAILRENVGRVPDKGGLHHGLCIFRAATPTPETGTHLSSTAPSARPASTHQHAHDVDGEQLRKLGAPNCGGQGPGAEEVRRSMAICISRGEKSAPHNDGASIGLEVQRARSTWELPSSQALTIGCEVEGQALEGFVARDEVVPDRIDHQAEKLVLLQEWGSGCRDRLPHTAWPPHARYVGEGWQGRYIPQCETSGVQARRRAMPHQLRRKAGGPIRGKSERSSKPSQHSSPR